MQVHVAGVAGLEPAERAGGGVLALRRGNELVVIRHQAVAPDFEFVSSGVDAEEAEEHVAAVTALCEVVKSTGEDDASAEKKDNGYCLYCSW